MRRGDKAHFHQYADQIDVAQNSIIGNQQIGMTVKFKSGKLFQYPFAQGGGKPQSAGIIHSRVNRGCLGRIFGSSGRGFVIAFIGLIIDLETANSAVTNISIAVKGYKENLRILSLNVKKQSSLRTGTITVEKSSTAVGHKITINVEDVL